MIRSEHVALRTMSSHLQEKKKIRAEINKIET